jgi:DnaJ-class molecular chaperone
MAKFCSNCGNLVEQIDNYCPECGNLLRKPNKPITESKLIDCSRCNGKGVIIESTNNFNLITQAISQQKVSCPSCKGVGKIRI